MSEQSYEIMSELKRYQLYYAKKKVNMYKIIVSQHVDNLIDRYWDWYRDIFISRFSDTGLWHAESLIQRQYIESSELLVDGIIEAIYQAMSNELVPYAPFQNGIRETSIRLGARRLFIRYEEDSQDMTRYITDIEILRR